MPKNLNECVVAGKLTDKGCFLGKNRDRSYIPNVEIIHGVYPYLEYVILHDLDTGYMEGVNDTTGWAILNSALLNGVDFGKNRSDEGKHVMLALLKCNTLEDILDSLTRKYPVYGNTIIASQNSICILEAIPEQAKYKTYDADGDYVVRTNHGVLVPDGGYKPTDSQNYLSSTTRMASSEIIIDNSDNMDEFLSGLCYPIFGKYNLINPTRRSTNYMNTTAQIGIDMENKVFKFSNFPKKNVYKGVKKLGDKNIKPNYKIVIEEPKTPVNIPFLTWGLR